MSKKYLITWGMTLISLTLITWVVLIFMGDVKPQELTSPLADTQTVTKTEEVTRSELPLNPERLRQLEQLQTVNESYNTQYSNTLESVLVMSWVNDTHQAKTDIENLLTENISLQEFQKRLEKDYGIAMMTADARRLVEAYETQQEENTVHMARLENLQESNKQDIQNQELELIELSVDKALIENNIALSSRERIRDWLKLRLKGNEVFFESNHIERWEILSDTLRFLIHRHTSYRWWDINVFIDDILSDFVNLWIIQYGDIVQAEDEISFLPNIFFNLAAADEPTILSYEDLLLESIEYLSSKWNEWLTDIEKLILHLQIDILTDITIQKSIDVELRFMRDEIDEEDFEILRFQYYELLEEILLIKKTIDKPEWVLSLGDIQAFGLWYYEDDSEEIENLDPIAYIQSVDGYVIVENLKGSNRLGTFNMILYPWYSIETLANSEATIIFADDSILRIEPRSRVTLTWEISDITTTVERGSTWTRVVKPFLSWDRFVIEWDGVSLWVRGTSVYFSETERKVEVVDTHSPDAWVEVLGTDTVLSAWERLDLDNRTTSSTDREHILTENPQVGNYIRDDLRQLSLLLDDKRRWFHNNPLGINFGDDTYLDRLEAEITSSLPRSQNESNAIFQTAALRDIEVSKLSSKNIHFKITQDTIIYELEKSDNTLSEINTKRSAILEVSSDDITKIENKRELEERIQLWLAQDIILKPVVTPNDIKVAIDEFPVLSRQQEREVLKKAEEILRFDVLNNGNTIVSWEFDLPDMISGHELWIDDDIIITNWSSGDSNILDINEWIARRWSDTWWVRVRAELRLNTQHSIADFEFVIPERKKSHEEELKKIAKEYMEFLNSFGRYITRDMFYETNLAYSHDQQLTWSDIKSSAKTWWAKMIFEGTHVLSNGEIDRPSYNTFTHIYDSGMHEKWSYTWTLNNRYLEVSDISITFIHPVDESVTHTIENESAYLKNISTCNSPSLLIWEWCYELVAKADYDTDLHLRDKEGNSINNKAPKTAWTWLSITSDKSNDQSKNSQIRNTVRKSTLYNNQQLSIDWKKAMKWLITVDWETWVLIRTEEDSFLSYNLSGLANELGEDWAIEMSVRGEDLRRNDGSLYTLIHSPQNFYIAISLWDSWNNPFELYIIKSISQNNFQKINVPPNVDQWELIIKNNNWELYVYINGISVTSNPVYIDSIIDDIYIWNFNWWEYQWNWVIQQIRIFNL